MKTLLVAISIFCLFFTLNAQINVEPGVVLIKLKNPDSTSIQGTSVINGGQSLQFTFQQYQMINSHMLPYAGPNMKGWYLLEFPINAPLDELKAALKCCPEIRYVALSVGGILCGNPNDPLWSYQWALQKARVHEAWDYTLPETDIIVGVLDTG